MAKTKVGKKLVSLVLALTMLFTVATAAVSANAGPLKKLNRANLSGLANAANVTVLLPVHTKYAIGFAGSLAAQEANDALKKAAIAAFLFQPENYLKDRAVTQTALTIHDFNNALEDVAIINGDAVLLGVATHHAIKEENRLLGHIAMRDTAVGLSLIPKTLGLVSIAKNIPEYVGHKALQAVGAGLIIRGLLPAHIHMLPVPHVAHIGIGLPLTVLGKGLSFGTGLILFGFNGFKALKDFNGIVNGGLLFNTPFTTTAALVNEALIPRHIVRRDLAQGAQLFGLGSIALGSGLLAHNVFELLTENIPSQIISKELTKARLTAAALLLAKAHVDDNIFWNVKTAKHVTRLNAAALLANGVVAANAIGLAGLTAVNAGVLGAAGLGAAGLAVAATPVVAGTAALAAATPVALGTAALGSAALKVAPLALGAAAVAPVALATAGIATTAALAAPVVATAVAAPVVGAALVGAGVAGATALGAGALGAAALASNLLGGNNSSSSNTTAATPVQTVANAVESVLPSNDQNTQTETQAQETTNTSDASVASTDGPIE